MTDRTLPAPVTLQWGIRLLLGQAAVVTAVFAYVVYRSATAPRVVVRDVVLVVVFTAVMAALLWLCGWALSRRYGWVRGPSVVLELMLLPIGYFMVAGGRTWIGLAVLALGLVGAGLLVAPATREALGLK